MDKYLQIITDKAEELYKVIERLEDTDPEFETLKNLHKDSVLFVKLLRDKLAQIFPPAT